MNLNLHINKWADCEKCTIGRCAKVLYRGSKNPRYLFIGSAPGISEDVIGKPFTGLAGKELEKLFDVTGCKSYGITNIIACYPAANNYKSKARNPTKEEIENCKERLDQLIETVTPNFYIALGKIAKQNPPSGIKYHLELDHPSSIVNQSPHKRKVAFNRNKNKLKSFLRETNGQTQKIN